MLKGLIMPRALWFLSKPDWLWELLFLKWWLLLLDFVPILNPVCVPGNWQSGEEQTPSPGAVCPRAANGHAVRGQWDQSAAARCQSVGITAFLVGNFLQVVSFWNRWVIFKNETGFFELNLTFFFAYAVLSTCSSVILYVHWDAEWFSSDLDTSWVLVSSWEPSRFDYQIH